MSWLGGTVLGRLVLKLLALVCACALWVYVDAVAMTTTAVTVKVSVVHEDGRPATEYRGEPPTVRITVRGPSDVMDCAALRTVSCAGRVPDGYAGGPVDVRIDESSVRLPARRGLVLVSVEPVPEPDGDGARR